MQEDREVTHSEEGMGTQVTPVRVQCWEDTGQTFRE